MIRPQGWPSFLSCCLADIDIHAKSHDRPLGLLHPKNNTGIEVGVRCPFIMYRFLSLVAISSLARASVIQHPLHESSNSQTLISSSKELVSSKALQGHITSNGLLKRAKDLFKIAELGTEEYNHPTRVIGSAGKLQIISGTSSTDCMSYRTPGNDRLHLFRSRRARRVLRNLEPDF